MNGDENLTTLPGDGLPAPPSTETPHPTAEVPAPLEPVDPQLVRAEVDRIVKSMEKLSRRGLNEHAITHLVFMALRGKVGIKTIDKVLSGLRRLPEIYGK